MADEEMPEFIASLTEIRLLANDDGTCTMTFFGSKPEPQEFSILFETSLVDWFGDVIRNCIPNEMFEEYMRKSAIIPNSPENVEEA